MMTERIGDRDVFAILEYSSVGEISVPEWNYAMNSPDLPAVPCSWSRFPAMARSGATARDRPGVRLANHILYSFSSTRSDSQNCKYVNVSSNGRRPHTDTAPPLGASIKASARLCVYTSWKRPFRQFMAMPRSPPPAPVCESCAYRSRPHLPASTARRLPECDQSSHL